ncbi:MAG: hypothetical protein ABFC18_03330 [Rikenellaceae bacterium]
MKDPAVLFYTSDFITGTLTMTDEQRGKYIILLCLQHQQGFLTKDDMMQICKSYDDKIFSKFDQDQFGYYYNPRMKKESEKRNKYIESRRENRKQKSEDKTNISKRYVKRMVNENINEIIDNSIEDLYKGVEIFFDEDLRPKTEKQKHEWLDTLDKLVRIDGYSPEHIQNIVKRARMDDFWKQNFLSVLKLRKKNKEGIMYFTVFEKKINGTTKTIGADPYELAKLEASKLGIQR